MLHAHVHLFFKKTDAVSSYIHVYIQCINNHDLHHVLDIAELMY